MRRTVVAAPRGAPPAQPPQEARRAPRENSALLERLGIAVRSSAQGTTVVAMDLDGPAATAGTEIGDIVVGINGAPVGGAAELDRLAGAAPAGQIVLDVMRRGERRQVAISNERPAAVAWNPLGFQVRELPRDTLKALGVAYGVMVTKVRAPAERTRILPGDVIVGVNQTPIRSMEEFNRLLSEHKSGMLGLLVRRTDSDLYISFQVGGGRDGDASRGGGAPRPEETFKTRATNTPLRT